MATKDITDKQVCKAYQSYKKQIGNLVFEPTDQINFPYDFLQEWTGQCFKVCYRAMERAKKRGYIEYGVSLRTGWLTDKGIELLAKSEYNHKLDYDEAVSNSAKQMSNEIDKQILANLIANHL